MTRLKRHTTYSKRLVIVMFQFKSNMKRTWVNLPTFSRGKISKASVVTKQKLGEIKIENVKKDLNLKQSSVYLGQIYENCRILFDHFCFSKTKSEHIPKIINMHELLGISSKLIKTSEVKAI